MIKKFFCLNLLFYIFLFSNNIPLSYVSRRLGHDSILTTEKYYLELMPEKKHSQDANALNLLASL